MPIFPVKVELEDGSTVLYSLQSRDKISKEQAGSYMQQYLDGGEKEYPKDPQGTEIKILPPSLQGTNRAKASQFYEEKIAGPVSRGVRSVGDPLKSKENVTETLGRSGLPVGLQESSEEALGLSEGSFQRAGQGAIQSAENVLTFPTNHPAEMIGTAAGLVAASFTGGASTVSPVMKLAATRAQRAMQILIPPMASGAATGLTSAALDPRMTREDVLDKGSQVAFLGIALNLAGAGLDRLMGNMSSRVDAKTQTRIQEAVNKRLNKDLPYTDSRQYIKAATQELDSIAENAYTASIDDLSKFVSQATNKKLGETFRNSVVDLKSEYVKLSKMSLGDEGFTEQSQKVLSLLDNTKKIALQSKDDLLPYIVAQDRELIADMLRLGYVDKEGAEALLRNATHIGGEAYRAGQKLAKPAKNLSEALTLPQRQALQEYIDNAPGKMAQIRELQQVQALDEWYARMQGVTSDIAELTKYKQTLDIINKSGGDTLKLRQSLLSQTQEEQSEPLEQLLTAVYDTARRNLSSRDLRAGFQVNIPKTKREIKLGTRANYLPSSGIKGIRPGSSGAINFVTLKTLRSLNNNSTDTEQ